jgi:hypothetical protein
VAGSLCRADQGAFRLDRDRSAVEMVRTRAFPRNTEIEAALTFTSDNPGPAVRAHTPDGRALTLREHLSFVRLPEPGYRPRAFHPQAGYFPTTFWDFASRSMTIPRATSPASPDQAEPRYRADPVTPIVLTDRGSRSCTAPRSARRGGQVLKPRVTNALLKCRWAWTPWMLVPRDPWVPARLDTRRSVVVDPRRRSSRPRFEWTRTARRWTSTSTRGRFRSRPDSTTGTPPGSRRSRRAPMPRPLRWPAAGSTPRMRSATRSASPTTSSRELRSRERHGLSARSSRWPASRSISGTRTAMPRRLGHAGHPVRLHGVSVIAKGGLAPRGGPPQPGHHEPDDEGSYPAATTWPTEPT